MCHFSIKTYFLRRLLPQSTVSRSIFNNQMSYKERQVLKLERLFCSLDMDLLATNFSQPHYSRLPSHFIRMSTISSDDQTDPSKVSQGTQESLQDVSERLWTQLKSQAKVFDDHLGKPWMCDLPVSTSASEIHC